jgi:uncharacterized protein
MQLTPKVKLLLSSFIFSFFFNTILAQNIPLINSGELLEQGKELHNKEKYKEALALYNKININDTNYSTALYEKAYSLYADSQMTKALQYAQEGFKKYPEMSNLYSMLLGNIQDDLDKPEEAIATYKEGLRLDPNSDILRFNIGVTYQRQKNYEKSLEYFRDLAMVNPYYASNHYFMGNVYLLNGNIVPAVLAYITYLSIAPSGRYQEEAIKRISAIANINEEVTELMSKKKNSSEDDFSEIQEIVASKIALNKEYKLKASLEDKIVRQLQVIFEKLSYNKNDKGFAMQYYVPYYSTLLGSKEFEAFVYNIFSGLDIAKIKSWVKDHKKDLEKMAASYRKYFDEIKETRVLTTADRANTSVRYLFDGSTILGKGQLKQNGKNYIFQGPWEFYYSTGILKSKGTFADDSKKDGEWQYFYEDGLLKEKTFFKNNEQNGSSQAWHKNGNLRYTQMAKNDKLEGEEIVYFYNGAIKIKATYKDGKQEGKEYVYDNSGFLKEVTEYVNGVKEGAYTSYYPTGEVKLKATYVKDKLNGDFKQFYKNGKLDQEGKLNNDKKEGDWITYHSNGQIKEKSIYKNDDAIGAYTQYHDNGKIESKGTLSKGKLDGAIEYYNDEEKLISKYNYDRGKIKEVSFFDKKGKELFNTTISKGGDRIVFYTEDGIKVSEGTYNKKGEQLGVHTYYYTNGTIKTAENYEDDILKGAVKTYYANGKLKGEYNYVEGKETGYLKEYYVNGAVKIEGNVIDGVKQQEFMEYDQFGNKEAQSFYVDDELDGETYYFTPNNKHSYTYTYKDGWLASIEQLDTTGKTMVLNTFPKGNGKYVAKLFNGKNFIEGNYEKYNLEGAYKVYYPDGTISAQYNYKGGYREGAYKSYFLGGKLMDEGEYKHGKKVGSWKYYYDNGQLREIENYVDGNIEGEDKLYNRDGTLDRILHYKEGDYDGTYEIYSGKNELMAKLIFKAGTIIGYTYEDKNGILVPMIPLVGGNGTVTAYYKNGTKSIDQTYSAYEVNGKRTQYFSNGKVYIEGSRVLGEDDGEKKIYFSNGNLDRKATYVNGSLHGNFTIYYANGKVKAEENYYNDAIHGTAKYYDELGKLTRTCYYYYGVLYTIK